MSLGNRSFGFALAPPMMAELELMNHKEATRRAKEYADYLDEPVTRREFEEFKGQIFDRITNLEERLRSA